jgi:hypothetical protein
MEPTVHRRGLPLELTICSAKARLGVILAPGVTTFAGNGESWQRKIGSGVPSFT